MPKKQPNPIPDLLPTVEVAAILNRHVGTVTRMVATGAIKPAVKIPGRTGAFLFERAEVERVAKELAA